MSDQRLWLFNYDGEYNEQSMLVDDVNITIFSDRDGELWSVRIGDNGNMMDLDATDVYAARREALQIFKEGGH